MLRRALALEQPDHGILRKAQRGDERAFSIIVRAYERPVYNYVLRLVGDRALAEDLTQEVFLRVYQGLPGFSLRSRFTTWMFQVTKNRVLDELRSIERRPRSVVNIDDIAPLESLDAPFERAETIGALWRSVEALNVDLKMALLLRDVVGLSYTEIADSLEITLATVKWRIYKAREEVQAALVRDGVGVATSSGRRPQHDHRIAACSGLAVRRKRAKASNDVPVGSTHRRLLGRAIRRSTVRARLMPRVAGTDSGASADTPRTPSGELFHLRRKFFLPIASFTVRSDSSSRRKDFPFMKRLLLLSSPGNRRARTCRSSLSDRHAHASRHRGRQGSRHTMRSSSRFRAARCRRSWPLLPSAGRMSVARCRSATRLCPDDSRSRSASL